eukprot:c15108_g1_i1 orf=225-1154(+)
MKLSCYEELRSVLLHTPHPSQALQAARAKFPHLPFDSLLSIQSQEQSRRLRFAYHKLRNPQAVQEYISRYVSGEDILEICACYNIPPCVLARFLLECLFGLSKQQITQCLKDPSSLPEDRINEVCQSLGKDLPYTPCESKDNAACKSGENACPKISWTRVHLDLYRCMDSDSLSSPYVEMIRRVTGMEYEVYLYQKLRSLGIAFQTENALRAAGFSKTPDVKLEVPIGVRGRLVNWIDSKASFGDEYNHKVQAKDQFQRYVNRFGPGMVIYWFGFIDELDDHPEILLLDSFPMASEIYCLPRLNVKPWP